MRSIVQTFQVRYQYPVQFTRDVFSPDNPTLRDAVTGGGDPLPREVLFALDWGMYRHHPELATQILKYCHAHRDTIRMAAPPIVVEGGEGVKNDPQYLNALYEAIHTNGLCRHSYLVAVGGGAMLDVAGYAASTAHRGIRLIRVPTTVLAQADSGIGVKNSINAFDKKNFLGAFAPPFAVLNDPLFLGTLSDRDWRSGLAEAIKVSLIRDAGFFGFLERTAAALVARDLPTMEEAIYRCAALHLEHIGSGGDPFESGTSRPLDFGHWAAHKLEQLSHYQLRHGEAVAVGMALDATYSHLAGFLGEAPWRRVLTLLSQLGFALHVPELEAHGHDHNHRHSRSILRGLPEFREHLGGRLTVMLLRGIGRGFEVHDIDETLCLESIAVLEHLQAQRTPSGGASHGDGKGQLPADRDPADRAVFHRESNPGAGAGSVSGSSRAGSGA